MNIFDLLTGKKSSDNSQQQQHQGIPPQQQNIQNQNDGQQQQQQQMQAEPSGFPTNSQQQNPFAELDVLQLLLDNGDQQQKSAPQFNIPRKNLEEVAGKMDFLQNIPQELIANIDPNTLQALAPLLNHIGRQSYTNALEHSMQLSGKYLDSRFDFERDGMSSLLRQQSVTNNINSIDKLHPLMQDLFRTAASKLADKFPTATSQEIESQVWKMFGSMNSNIDNGDPSKIQQRINSQPKEEDWDLAGGFAQPTQSSGPQ